MSLGTVVTIPLSPEIVTSGAGISAIHALEIKQSGTAVTTIKRYCAANTTFEILFTVPAGHVLGLEVSGTTTPRTNPFTVNGSTAGEHDTDVTLTSTTTTASARATLKVKIETKPTQDDARPKPALL
jgi:hypothetical protein